MNSWQLTGCCNCPNAGGETMIGFGTAPAAPADKPADKVAEQPAAPAALPAFLQPANVQAVYGSAEKAQQ